jgi:Tfp pilus assembly protein PilX
MVVDNKQRGAASLIVVIFTVLILSLIIVSFVHIMLSDQQQATSNDLSQSAYDSAQVGVEDAKRAILRYQNICDTGTLAACNAAYTELTSSTCNHANSIVTDSAAYNATTLEVKVQTSTSNKLDQAYTCVKITLDTFDYIGDLKKDESRLIPLIGDSSFNTIKIEWFNSADVLGLGATVNVPGNPTSLLTLPSWTGTLISPTNYPAVMRTQLIQYNTSGFKLADLDTNTGGGFNSTMFLYPSSVSTIPVTGFPSARITPTFSPYRVVCNSANLLANGYACSATIKLPMTQAAGARSAYLNLASLYKESHYKVSMSNSASSCNMVTGVGCVRFHAIQPEVDSTGRANNLYRRVDARVGLGDITFPYPKAEIDLTNNFCKNFQVTDNPVDYVNLCSF